jgi:hypothetical protein
MRFLLALLAAGLLAAGCSTLPRPGVGSVGSGVPQSCSERLTESSCREGIRCNWVNDSRRSDGTIATAHCESK